MNKFGTYLKAYLDYKSISIEEFSNMTNYDSSYIKDIIDSKVLITDDIITKISNSTGISESFIRNMESNYLYKKYINDYLSFNNINIHEFIDDLYYKDFAKINNFKFCDERCEYDIAIDILKYMGVIYPNNLFI